MLRPEYRNSVAGGVVLAGLLAYAVKESPPATLSPATSTSITTTSTSSGIGTIETLPATPPAVTPTTMPPSFAYAADQNKNYIAMFGVDQTTGILTALGTKETGAKPYFLVADPQGNFVFVTNFNDGSVTSFRIDRSTGTLETVGTTILPNSTRAIALAIDPAGRHLYALIDLANELYVYNISGSGALTYLTVEVTGQDPLAMQFTPDGKYAYVANNGSNDISCYTVNADGSLAPIETVVAGVSPNALVMDPQERVLYVENYMPNNIFGYAIDYATGRLGLLRKSPATTDSDPWSMAFDPLGRYLYVANFSANLIAVYNIDAVTGALVAQISATYSGISRPRFVTADPSGKFVYACDDNGIAIFRIRNALGELQFVKSDTTVSNSNAIVIVR